MSTKVRPLNNRVLVKRSEAPKTKGGILLPDSAQEKPKEGTVIAAGPGKANEEGVVEPLTVTEGDRVLFSSYAGTEVTMDEETLLIMSEDDILGILS
ncbi:10 kDa chaperonin [Chlamydiales bacterium SCGC AG-110-P3]|nr:10 kDa chaperonin [Chlamydiales bacterium SCGC AG-110-P3]